MPSLTVSPSLPFSSRRVGMAKGFMGVLHVRWGHGLLRPGLTELPWNLRPRV